MPNYYYYSLEALRPANYHVASLVFCHNFMVDASNLLVVYRIDGPRSPTRSLKIAV